MPRWVEPDPPDDGEGDTGDAGEAAGGATANEDLNTKPVLDWTNEDWARWIDSADTYLPPREPAEEPAPVALEAEPEAEAEPAADEPEPLAQDDVGADMTDLEPWAEDVFDDLELWSSPPVGAPEPPEEDWNPLVASPLPTPEPVDLLEPVPWETAPAAAADADEDQVIELELEPTGEWILEPEPPSRVETVDPAPSVESTGPWTDAEWAAVAEHPWWESAPEPDPATARVVRLPVPEEPAAELAVDEPPTILPPPPLEPIVAADAAPWTAPRITRPRPAVPGSAPAPARMVADTTHRVRSAFGLLGMSLLIGTMTAALITVIVFALSLALRRAVG